MNTNTDRNLLPLSTLVIKSSVWLLAIGWMGVFWWGTWQWGILQKEKFENFSDAQNLCRAKGSTPTWNQYPESEWTQGGWCTPTPPKK